MITTPEEKPDFDNLKYWDALFNFRLGNEDRAAALAANHVWGKYVEPLQKELKEREEQWISKVKAAFDAGRGFEYGEQFGLVPNPNPTKDQWLKDNGITE